MDVLLTVQKTFGIDAQLRGREAWFSCPNPEHVDRNPSCSINVETGLWRCKGCGARGNLVTLGSVRFQIPVDEAEAMVWGGDSEQAHLRYRLAEKVSRRSSEAPQKPVGRLDPPDRYQDGPLDSLVARGFSERFLRWWGVRYVERTVIEVNKTATNPLGEATIANSIAIPLCTANGELAAWCYRRTDQSPRWQPRYLYTLHAPLKTLLFGMEKLSNIAAPSQDAIAITEGGLDAMWLWQNHQPAVAILGSGSTEKAYDLDNYNLLLFFDKDDAGRIATRAVGEAMWAKTGVSVVRYPRSAKAYKDPAKRKDPADLKAHYVRRCIDRAVPYSSWRLSQKLAESSSWT